MKSKTIIAIQMKPVEHIIWTSKQILVNFIL